MTPRIDRPDVRERAEIHAALGDPIRLAIVDDLAGSDRAPSELARTLDLPTNLLAHHLAVLERAALVERIASAGDGRRRYVRLRRERLADADLHPLRPSAPVLFVCTHNSARSQLAAALWRARTGTHAGSAGTHPAERVHPGAVAAAARAGLDMGSAAPRLLDSAEAARAFVVTVCDRAHEELEPPEAWSHWSTPDPVEVGTRGAFDATVRSLDDRIAALTT